MILSSPTTSTRTAEPSDLGALLRRGWLVVAVAVTLGVIGGVVLTNLQQARYTASSSVLVTATGVSDSTNLANSRTAGSTINLDTEAQLARSTQVAERVKVIDSARRSTPTQQLLENLSVSVPANTSVLRLSYTANTARAAAQTANDFAASYLYIRANNAQATLDDQIKKVSGNISAKMKELRGVATSLATLPTGSKLRNFTQAERALLITQVSNLTTQYNKLSATVVTPGVVLSKAIVPSTPSSPSLLLNVAAGLALGLLVGLLIAWLRFAKPRRMSRPDDVARLIHVPVVGTVNRLDVRGLEPVATPAGIEYQHVANLVAASIGTDGVVLVTGASADSPTDIVAANLGAALVRSSVYVTLLSLTGNNDVASVNLGPVYLAERDPSLQVAGAITRNRLDLIRRGGYLIVTVTDAGTSADAQTLATLSDAVLVVVAARTKVRDGRNAIDQLDAVGAPILGAVLVPGARPVRAPRPLVSGAGDATTKSDQPVDADAAATATAAAGTSNRTAGPAPERSAPGVPRDHAVGDGTVAQDNSAGVPQGMARSTTSLADSESAAAVPPTEGSISSAALVRARFRARADRPHTR
jgi:succinoglycan biosynthesis transport protein ExoP